MMLQRLLSKHSDFGLSEKVGEGWVVADCLRNKLVRATGKGRLGNLKGRINLEWGWGILQLRSFFGQKKVCYGLGGGGGG